MIHIFFPIGSFYPAQSGGPNNTVYWLAKALVAREYQVTVVSTTRDLPSEIPTDTWIQTIYGRVMYVTTRFFRLPVRQFRQCLQVKSAAIVHLTSLFYPLSLPMALWALTLGKRVIWSVHGELDPEALLFNPFPKRIFLSAIRLLSQRIFFHSTCTAESSYVRQHFGVNCHLVEVPNFMELPSVIARVPEPYVLYIGRIHPKKAIERLIEAVASSAVFRTNSWRLIIAGDDTNNYATNLKNLVSQYGLNDQIKFVGVITGLPKQQLYANAYLTVLPSHTENFGLVVIESMAQGTPVIASKGTPWQLLDQEQVGLWVDNDSAALQQAIDSFLKMPVDQYEQYRQRALNVVQTNFDVYTNIDQWTSIYSSL